MLVALCGAAGRARLCAAEQPFASRHAELRAAYVRELAELADWADGQQLSTEAAYTAPVAPGCRAGGALPCRPTLGGTAHEPADSANPAWRERFANFAMQAAALFALAQEATVAGQSGTAWQMLPEVIREEPAHARGRAILGYEEFEGAGRPPSRFPKLAKGKCGIHALAGCGPTAWRPTKPASGFTRSLDVGRGRSGPGRPQRLGHPHRALQDPHHLRLGRGGAAGQRLEHLHDAWQQLFVGFWGNEAQLASRFAANPPGQTPPARHRVIYFRNREEYVEALSRDEPNIGVSTGYYSTAKRTAYFFAGDKPDDASNIYHEATHQLFHEVPQRRRALGTAANFWVVEGIACYMESLATRDGWHFLGGEDAQRLRDAVHRLTESKFYVPLAELVTYGRERLKSDPNLPLLYSQSSGLTYFFMHGADERYRGASWLTWPRFINWRTGPKRWPTCAVPATPNWTPSTGDSSRRRSSPGRVSRVPNWAPSVFAMHGTQWRTLHRRGGKGFSTGPQSR